ncbi:MAG: cell envelope biogenesis protein TolA [Myxococcaceae bacterium]
MAVALILESIALVVCLYILLLGRKDQPAAVKGGSQDAAPVKETRSGDSAGTAKLEADLGAKKKELEEQKKFNNDLKDELKTLKRKLYDEKESHKGQDDLAKARADVERQASIQLESTRAELATALAEVAKLKSGNEGGGRRREAAPAERAPSEAKADHPAPPPPQRVIRELSEGDKEKMRRAEEQLTKAREIEKDLKLAKQRGDGLNKQLRTARTEGNLAKDKFRAVEKRLNRVLLEKDLTLRALKDLEKKTGTTAERTELTADEVAASDKTIEAKQAAEDKAEAEAKAKIEAQEAAAAAAAAAAPAPEAAPAAPTPSAPTT